jgi:hypothetical protein
MICPFDCQLYNKKTGILAGGSVSHIFCFNFYNSFEICLKLFIYSAFFYFLH